MRIPQLLLSGIYSFGCLIKNSLYTARILKPRKAPMKVISIGNISFGGTGKTPSSIEVIKFLQKKNRKVCLVTRGYKGIWEKNGGILSDGIDIFGTWQESGDEAYSSAQNLPDAGVFVGKDRFKSCVKAAQMGFEIAVLDDGFQHRKLFRDIDIVLLDEGRDVFFREFLSSIKRADILLIKKNTGILNPPLLTLKKRAPLIPIYSYRIAPQGIYRVGRNLPPTASDFFQNKKTLAFCGIAKPERFFSLLNEMGIYPAQSMIYPDHHPYPNSSIKKILKTIHREKISVLITTEKDAVKIGQTSLSNVHAVYFLKIHVDIQEDFYQTLWSELENIPDTES